MSSVIDHLKDVDDMISPLVYDIDRQMEVVYKNYTKEMEVTTMTYKFLCDRVAYKLNPWVVWVPFTKVHLRAELDFIPKFGIIMPSRYAFNPHLLPPVV